MRAIYDFAINPPEGVEFPPLNYKEANVDYCLTIGLDGEVLRVEKENRKILTPDLNRSGKMPPPIICFDKFNYFVKTSPDKAARIQSSIDLYDRAIILTQDPNLKAILAFIHREYTLSQLESLKEERGAIKDDAKCIFRIVGQEKYLHQSPIIIDCWQQLRKEDLKLEDGECSISIEITKIVNQEFLKVGGIPDSEGKPGNGNFFTNNKKSVQNWNSNDSMFQHHVGLDAYIAIYNGLNYLLNNEHHYVRLGDAKYVFWAVGETGSKTIALKRMFSPKADVKETAPSAREVVTTLKSVFSYGGTNLQGNPDTFYIASFRRSNNRAWIDTMRQGGVSDIYKNMKKWITTQSIFTGKVYGIQSLASSLLSSAERNKQKSPLRSNIDAILQNSLFATPLPHDFLGTLVNRIAAAGKANKPQINLLTLTLDLMPMTTEGSTNVDSSQLCDREKDAYIFGRMTSFVRYVSHRVSPNKNTLADNLEQFFLQSPAVGATQMMKLFTMYVKSAKSTNYWRDRFNTEFPLVPVATRRFSLREQALYLIGANANDWYQAPPAKDNNDSENSLETRSIKIF
jgi:hypothetical protein